MVTLKNKDAINNNRKKDNILAELVDRIDAIAYNNEVYDFELNYEDLRDLIISLDANVFEELITEYKKLCFKDVINGQHHSCPKCKKIIILN